MTTRRKSADYAQALDTILAARLDSRPPASQQLRFAADLETSLHHRLRALGAEPVDAEFVDAEPVEAEPVQTEPVDAEPVDVGPVDADSETERDAAILEPR